MLGSALALIWHPVHAFAFRWPSVSLAFAEFDSIHQSTVTDTMDSLHSSMRVLQITNVC